MKRKVCALLLAVSCFLSMTACGGKETSNEEVIAEEVLDEEVEEPTAEPTEEPTAEPTEEPTAEPTEEPIEEEVEEEELTKPITEMPTTLSDDIYDFQISIDGTVYQFPMWYSDFEALGWEFEGDNTLTLSPNQYTGAEEWIKDGYMVSTSLANLSMNTVEYSECMVAAISFKKYYLEGCEWDIILPKGIQIGVSGVEDIKEAYGDPG